MTTPPQNPTPAYQARLWLEQEERITLQRQDYFQAEDSAKGAAESLRNRKKEVLKEARERNGAMEELAADAKKARNDLKELEAQALEQDPEYLRVKEIADELKAKEQDLKTRLQTAEEQSRQEAAGIIRALAGPERNER